MNENQIQKIVENEFEKWAKTKTFNSHLRKAFEVVYAAGASCGVKIAKIAFEKEMASFKEELLKENQNSRQ